jgi:peroxiredoxin (alkyl hydroperoxide reductase subunit C)
MSVLEPGSATPDFSLGTETGGRFTQDDLRGTPTILVFYPFAFSPVCTDQLSVYQEVLPDIEARGARIFGVSCDASWSQKAFRKSLGVTFPQLSDFEPKGAACEAFGVLHKGGFPQRALIVTDAAGTVRWSIQMPSPADLPGANLLFDGLAAAGQ